MTRCENGVAKGDDEWSAASFLDPHPQEVCSGEGLTLFIYQQVS